MKKFKVAIIGAGSAGLSARREVAKQTDNYVVIDPGPLGTTCARVGCMPSKVLIQVAEDFHRRKVFHHLGIEGSESLKLNPEKAMNHVRSLRDRFVKSVNHGIEDWKSDHLIQKKAKIIEDHVIDAEGEKITAEKIIIATGSRPIVPEKWKKYQKYFLDSDSIFELEKLPESLAVIGLGVIGVELGQAFSRLGVSVQGFDLRRSVGTLTDPEVLDQAIHKLSEEFSLHFDGAEILGEKDGKIQIRSGNFEGEFEKVLLSLGRKPNLDTLGLEKFDLEYQENRVPKFHPRNFQVFGKPWFLVGDVNAERPILHEASDEGRIAGFCATHEGDHCFQRRTSIGIVFTDPQIAKVGMSYQELQNSNLDWVEGSLDFSGQGRSIVKLKNKGLLKVYAEKKSGKILGSEIFGPDAEHLAHLLAWALSLNLTVEQALTLPFYHPVIEEGLRTALRELDSQIVKQLSVLELLRCEDPPAGTKV